MKYRALVADDEPMIRRGIMSFINSSEDFEVVAEAEDGEIALEKARSTAVDVFFVDINMPFMNGLDFIKELKMMYPEALVVIITGYDLFAYARKAVSLGVFDYVLKPLQEEVFSELLDRIRKELKERSKDELEKKYLEWAREKMKGSRGHLVSGLIKNILEDRLSDTEIRQEADYLGITLPEDYTVIIVRTDVKASGSSSDWNEDLIYFVSENIALEMFASLSAETRCRDEAGSFVLLTKAQDAAVLDEKIKDYTEYVSSIMPVKCAVATAFGHGLSEISNSYRQATAETAKNAGVSPLMEQVLALIEESYMREDFSLQEAADTIGLSLPYLSRMFRKEAGCTFVDYLTNLRMRKATIFLHDDSIKIYEVAERVGYSSQQYFSLVFKKKFGVSPIDYRQSIKR
ncbi:MAG: response regulator [Butyrivibrio sp.]|nr:response regulator [Butyrivibrio sp.]